MAISMIDADQSTPFLFCRSAMLRSFPQTFPNHWAPAVTAPPGYEVEVAVLCRVI